MPDLPDWTTALLGFLTAVAWMMHVLDQRTIRQQEREIGRLKADQGLCPKCFDAEILALEAENQPALSSSRLPSDPLH
jgi:hypothetical protein